MAAFVFCKCTHVDKVTWRAAINLKTNHSVTFHLDVS